MHGSGPPPEFGEDAFTRCLGCGGCAGCHQPGCEPCECNDVKMSAAVCDRGGSGHAGARYTWVLPLSGGLEVLALQSCARHFSFVSLLGSSRGLDGHRHAHGTPSEWRSNTKPLIARRAP